MVDTHDKREDMFVISPKHSGSYCQDLLRADVPYTALLKKKMKELSTRALEKMARPRHRPTGKEREKN